MLVGLGGTEGRMLTVPARERAREMAGTELSCTVGAGEVVRWLMDAVAKNC